MLRINRVIIASLLLIVVVTSVFLALNTSWARNCCLLDPGTDFFYVGRDWATRGNWTDQGYGKCGYALPYAEVKSTEVAIGETTGIGNSSHEYWWREPWSIPGEKYYPYEDYLGGENILEYEISGPEGAPRALVDADSMYYRPSWYYNDSSITVTLSVIAGDYNLSIYFLDWDAPSGGAHRKLQVNVTSNSDWDTATLGNTFLENFAAGTYAIFEVHSTGSITIQVTNLGSKIRYALIAGIFLDTISGPVTGVNFVELDRETKGNWRPKYGNDYHLLPGFNVPVSTMTYKPVNKLYDETNFPSGNYTVSEGACQFAADDARTYGEYPYIGQYAAYTWSRPPEETASDPRVLVYPEDKIYYGYPPTPLNGRIYGQWDAGEMGQPLNYFIMNLTIPNGIFIFSVYVMDFANAGRSETIEIWDKSMTILDSQYINSSEINNGTYIQWYVKGPTVINIKTIADPGKLNCFIDGIFLNCASLHDIAIINVTTNTPHEYPCRIVNITVLVKNNGDASETFNVTAYRNSTEIGKILVTNLGIGENTTLIFHWNTTGLIPCHTWTIRAEAPLTADINPSDNNFTDGTVKIKGYGDVNADGVVDGQDVISVIEAMPSYPSHPWWNPQADINNDGVVDGTDLIIVLANVGIPCSTMPQPPDC